MEMAERNHPPPPPRAHTYKQKNTLSMSHLSSPMQQMHREMICPQYFHNIFITNLKWQIITDCYCQGKNVILVLGSNLNQ